MNHLSEILLRAGYFEKIAGQIRKSAMLSPEQMKTEKLRLQTDVAKYTLAIKNTFRFQSELGDDPEALKELAAEIKGLSQKKKASETALEELKGQETLETDVDDAIDDLKGRIDSFRRGFTKANVMTKKSLIQGLIHSIQVTQKGLSIEYRLKHGLNSSGTQPEPQAASETDSNVIPFATARRSNPFTAASEPISDNESISGSRVEGIGSERGT